MGLLQPHERHGGGAGQAEIIRLVAAGTKSNGGAARRDDGNAKRRRSEAPQKLPPAIVIHSLAQARGALAAAAAFGIEVELWSAPGAAAYAGAGWFQAVIRAARSAVPMASCRAVLDCGDAPGLVLNALRGGLQSVCFTGAPRLAQKLAQIAAARGFELRRTRPATLLELRHAAEPAAACRAWLERQRG
jgi:hypothetical protein